MDSKTDSKIVQQGVFLGKRDDTFRNLIKNVLSKGDCSEKFIDKFLSDKVMKGYDTVFTSSTIDPENNYENYEQIGDGSFNHFLVVYFYQRFPQLKKPKFHNIVARLKINYCSKASASKIAEELGFWNFISASNDFRAKNKKSLLEDVFEAFVGYTEEVLGENDPCIGFSGIYPILKGIFDTMDISLEYEDLYDSKTIVKEIFDVNYTLGTAEYESVIMNNGYTQSSLYGFPGTDQEKNDRGKMIVKTKGKKSILGIGVAPTKMAAEQIAAKQGLIALKAAGFTKKIPEIFQELNNTEESVEIKIEKTTDINHIFSKYLSGVATQYTLLGYCCQRKDKKGIIACLKKGANVNISNHVGLFPLDLLCIGKKLYKSCIKAFFENCTENSVHIHRNIYENYLINYENLESIKNRLRII